MNQTIEQIYGEYREQLKILFGHYESTPTFFEDGEAVEEFISEVERYKTLVALYADLQRAAGH